MSRSRLLLVLGILLGVCGTLLAQSAGSVNGEERYDPLLRYWHAMDVDGDGYVTKMELNNFLYKIYGHTMTDDEVRASKRFRIENVSWREQKSALWPLGGTFLCSKY